MNNSLAKEFDLKSLLRFSAPSIAMMVFTSLYTIVDGIFVSNLVGTDALSAINICYPLLCFFNAISIMSVSYTHLIQNTSVSPGSILRPLWSGVHMSVLLYLTVKSSIERVLSDVL